MHYVIRPRVEPLGTGDYVATGDIVREIDERAGRSIGHYIAGTAIRKSKDDRAYVSGAKGHPSFIVELIR